MDDKKGIQVTTDHDLLIRLDAKVDGLVLTVNEMKDGTAKQLAEHEVRIKAIELINDQLNLRQMNSDVDSNKQWIHDFSFRWKVILAFCFTMGGAFMWMINNIKNIINFFGR